MVMAVYGENGNKINIKAYAKWANRRQRNEISEYAKVTTW
jgi:CobQ-like glutamine amidotransferase family enzyme